MRRIVVQLLFLVSILLPVVSVAQVADQSGNDDGAFANTCDGVRGDGVYNDIANTVAKISRYEFPSSLRSSDLAEIYQLVSLARNLVTNSRTVLIFRCNDNLSTIRKVIQMAQIDERAIRINAGLLLANVVDNTTVCAVLDALTSPDLAENPRFNLWQTVRVVSTYARLENRIWMKLVIEQNRKMLGDQSRYAKTLAVIVQVEQALSSNDKPGTLAISYPDELKACQELSGLAALVRN